MKSYGMQEIQPGTDRITEIAREYVTLDGVKALQTSVYRRLASDQTQLVSRTAVSGDGLTQWAFDPVDTSRVVKTTTTQESAAKFTTASVYPDNTTASQTVTDGFATSARSRSEVVTAAAPDPFLRMGSVRDARTGENTGFEYYSDNTQKTVTDTARRAITRNLDEHGRNTATELPGIPVPKAATVHDTGELAGLRTYKSEKTDGRNDIVTDREPKRGPAILDAVIRIGVPAILVIAPTQYGFEVWKKTYLSAVDILLWVVFAAWALDRWSRAGFSGSARSLSVPSRIRLLVPVPVLLFLLASVLSCVNSRAPAASAKELFQLVEYFVVAFLLLSGQAADDKSLKRLLNVFLCVATVVAAWGLAQYLTVSVEPLGVKAAFGNRNVLGGYFSLVLPLMFGLLLFERRPVRILWLGAAIAVGLAANLSGGTLIALAVSFCVVSIMRNTRAFAVAVCALAVLFVLALPLLPRDNIRILSESVALYDEDVRVSARYVEWQAAANMTREHPLFGAGIGNYQIEIGGYYGTLPDRTGPTEPDTQNQYAVLASTTGLLGLACFVAMLAFFAAQAARAFFAAGDSFSKGLALGSLGAIMAFSINCIWTPLLVRGIGVPLAAVLSFAAAQCVQWKRPVEAKPGGST